MVEDIRAMKKRGEKISMLFVTTLEEAAAAAAMNETGIRGPDGSLPLPRPDPIGS